VSISVQAGREREQVARGHITSTALQCPIAHPSKQAPAHVAVPRTDEPDVRHAKDWSLSGHQPVRDACMLGYCQVTYGLDDERARGCQGRSEPGRYAHSNISPSPFSGPAPDPEALSTPCAAVQPSGEPPEAYLY